MDFEKAIRKIISGIPSDVAFDVHTVVQKLLKEHDDVYLANIGNYKSAAQYHSKISSIIAHETDMVERIGNSYSKNIHSKFSECHIFKRITVKKKTVKHDKTTAKSEINVNLEEEIRLRAYQLYQERNGQNGDAYGDWCKAVPEICSKYETAGYKSYTEFGSWWARKS